MPVTLKQAAEMLKVHPRTILRATEKESNPYHSRYIDGINIRKADLCRAFGLDSDLYERLLKGRDELITTDDIPRVTGAEIGKRMIRMRKYPKAIDRGVLVRYSRREVIQFHLRHFVSDDDFDSLL